MNPKNEIRNPIMEGAVAGTPGTLPTHWGDGSGGLSREIVAVGVENNINYIDIRYFGTTTAGVSTISIRIDDSTTQIPAQEGDEYSLKAWMKVVSSPEPPISYRFLVQEFAAESVFVKQHSHTLALGSDFERFVFELKIDGGATTEYARPIIQAVVSGESSYDFTVRIGRPLMAILTEDGDIRTANTLANTATMSVSASNANSAYRILDTPQIEAFYTNLPNPETVQVSAGNIRSAYRARVYEAVGIKNNFTANVINLEAGEPDVVFEHTGEDAKRAYKYKVSYFVTGNIGGSLVEHEGTRCAPVYLLGESE